MIARVERHWMLGAQLSVGLAMLVTGWVAIWTTTSYLNPIAFASLWTGAALLMWIAGPGYPGLRRHIALATISIPLWWYFEAVNGRTENWQYIGSDRYDDFTYAVFASVSFATVVPALVAATSMINGAGFASSEGRSTTRRHDASHALAAWLIGLGIVSEAATLILPEVFYPLVWIAPFLIIDGLVVAVRGRSIVRDLSDGVWQRAAIIAGAGLLCGGLWEFWNFWAMPKWTYAIPLLDFAPVFEMPILGYGGYIPFAWSVLQLVLLVDIAMRRVRSRTITT